MGCTQGNRRSSYAIGAVYFTFFAFFSISVACFTSYWIIILAPNNELEGHVGLWEACFHHHNSYGPNFRISKPNWNCESYYGKSESNRDTIPPFFVRTLVVFTICMLLSLIGILLGLLYYFRCSINDTRYVMYVYCTSVIMVISSVFGLAAVIIFTSNVLEERIYSEASPFGWSYALAWAGVLANVVAGGLFCTDGYIQLKGNRNSTYGIGAVFFIIVGFVSVSVAYFTSYWVTMVTSYNKLDGHIGLWEACFNLDFSFESPALYAEPKWICESYYKPTEKQKDSTPPFIARTQVLFTVCFTLSVIGIPLGYFYYFHCNPDMKHYVMYIYTTSIIMVISSLFGLPAIIIFTSNIRTQKFLPAEVMPFGWSYALAWAGILANFVAAGLFFIDGYLQMKANRAVKLTTCIEQRQELTSNY